MDVDTLSDKIVKFRDFLLANIKGQDRAVRSALDAFEIYFGGFKRAGKPICVILCLGPSGVGKTLFAEMIALYLVGDSGALTRIACETCAEPHSTARLTGAPPGYVGYHEPPILAQDNIDKHAISPSAQEQTKKVAESSKKFLQEKEHTEKEIFRLLGRLYFGGSPPITPQEEMNLKKIIKILVIKRNALEIKLEALGGKTDELTVKNPISVLLWDEIEKAHQNVHNMILNIADKALLVLSNGDVTHFDNSIMILTSNVGSEDIAEVATKATRRPIGYWVGEKSREFKSQNQEAYEKAMSAAKRVFRPEFLARMHICVFNFLSHEALCDIYDHEVDKFKKECLDPLYIGLKISSEAREFIIAEATDNPAEGARLIVKKITNHIEKRIVRLKSRGELDPGDTVCIVLDKDENGKPIRKRNGKFKLAYYKEPPVLTEAPKDPGPDLMDSSPSPTDDSGGSSGSLL